MGLGHPRPLSVCVECGLAGHALPQCPERVALVVPPSALCDPFGAMPLSAQRTDDVIELPRDDGDSADVVLPGSRLRVHGI